MFDYEFDVIQRVQELGYDVSEISPAQEMSLRQGLVQIVDAAYSKIKESAQNRLHKTRLDYLKALDKKSIGHDEYLLTISEKAEHLESGFSSFDMKPGLLHGPNAKVSAKGVMYNIVPLQGSPEYGSSPKETVFRVVTSNSPPNSWIHPGFIGIHAFDEAADYLDSEIDNMIVMILG